MMDRMAKPHVFTVCDNHLSGHIISWEIGLDVQELIMSKYILFSIITP
jgi:hypothetical protein